MSKNKGLSRFAERAGWSVTLVTFFAGTMLLQAYQDNFQTEQQEGMSNHSQVEKVNLGKRVDSQISSLVAVKSKSLPPSDSNIGHAFWVSEQLDVMVTELTKEVYNSVMFGSVASDEPMLFSQVQDVQKFANSLSIQQGLEPCYANDKLLNDCTGWRIPYDNEWMLFANAGQGTKYAGSDVFTDVGWPKSKVYNVASKPPNQWGLYDMSGGNPELILDHRTKNYGLLGDERPLVEMNIQRVQVSFAVRLVRTTQIESKRN